MKGLVVTSNVAYSAQYTWGSEMAEAQLKIKSKYLYNKVHDAKSIVAMMKYLDAADKQRNCQEATAPETETANMVKLGIELLQHLVHQPPSEYASNDRDDDSAMSEMLESKSSVEKMRYRARGRNKDKKGCRHRHRSRSLSTSLSHSPPQYCRKSLARRSVSRKLDKRDINPTNCTP